MLTDVRQTLRSLRKTPGFAALAVIVLALGIGLNTAIFSLINAAIFAPPPGVQAPGELRYVYLNPESWVLRHPDFLLLRSSNTVFGDMATVTPDSAKLGDGGDVHLVAGESVSNNYFEMLGLRPAIGTTFGPEVDRPDAAFVVVLSDRLWTREFDRSLDIVGKTIRLPRQGLTAAQQWPSYTVVGVMPPEVRGVYSPFAATDYWVPRSQRARDFANPRTGVIGSLERSAVFLILGRLKPGATDARAQVEFSALAAQIRTGERLKLPEWSLSVQSERRVSLPFARVSGSAVSARLATGLLVVAGVVLLVATMNLAGMLMARGLSRQAEVGARLTLGASRIRIVRLLFVESALLAAAGGAGGLLLARVLTLAFQSRTPGVFGTFERTEFSFDVPIDGRVLAFALVVSLLTAVLVTLAPARQAWRTNVIAILAGGAGLNQTGRLRARVRHWVVVPQVALSVALLIVAGSIGRPLIRAAVAHPGYDPDNVAYVTFDVAHPDPRIDKDAKLRDEFLTGRSNATRRILDRAGSIPGVTSAALTSMPPSTNNSTWLSTRRMYASNQRRWISQHEVSLDYFETMGIKVKAGRAFDLADTPDSPPVAIICERMAKWLFPGQNPIGQHVAQNWPDSNYPPRWMEVVGVVNEIQTPLTDGASPFLYTSMTQDKHWYALTLLVRGTRPQGELVRDARHLIAGADPGIEIMASGRLIDALDATAYPRRMGATIISLAGMFGLFLSAVGIYGVVSHSVAQRIREIGIRATLGASRASLMSLILRDGLIVAIAGSAVGMVLAFIATRVVTSMFASMPQPDFGTAAIVPGIITASILLACIAPARRASKVDPIVVLRDY